MAALCGWMVVGCATVDNPAPGSLARVNIEGHSAVQVDDALRAVFAEKHYKVHFDTFVPRCDAYQLELGRKGSAMNRLAYGDWLNPAVDERVKVSVSRAPGGWLIALEAFMASNNNEPFEEEHRLTGLTHDTYQRLLDAVKARLR